MKIKAALLFILSLGFLLRFWNLSSNPPALSWDEVSHGYNAYSLLKSGQDEWGQSYPIANFRAYGDYPTTLYMYMSIPFIATLGLNETAIRLPSVIFGTGLIWVIYLLVSTVTKNRMLGLVGAFLAAVSPWGILTSRQVLQATPAVTLMMLGIWFFLKKKPVYFLLGTISLGISAYAYHNTRILAPLVFLVLVTFFGRVLILNKKIGVLVILLGVLFFGPLIPVLTSGEGSARAAWVGILDQGAINRINEGRGSSGLPGPLPTILNNKYLYFATVSGVNYIGYFSPQFLAFEGGTQYQFSVPHFGLINPLELPFFYLGLLLALVRLRRFDHRKDMGLEHVMLIMLLISPLPAAITRDPYQVVRGLTMMPLVHIFACLGGLVIWNYLRRLSKKLTIGILVAALLIGVVFEVSYLDNLFRSYPKDYAFAWQYGYKQAIEYALANQDRYSRVMFTKKYGEPHEFVLFYSQSDPVMFRSDPNLVRYNQSNWYWVDSFGRYEFINDWEIEEKTKERKNVLLVTSPGNYPKTAKLLKTVDYPNGQSTFDIVELN